MQIEVLSGETDFQGLGSGAHWNDLLQVSCARSIFSTYEWLSTWWQFYGQGKRMRLLAAHQDGRLVGLAPFVLRRREGFTEAVLMGGHVTDYKDVLIADGVDRPAVLEGMLTRLLADRSVDGVRVSALREDSPNYTLLEGLADRLRPWRPSLLEYTVSPHVTIAGAWEDYWRALGKGFKQSTRQGLAKLARDYGEGGIRHTTAGDEETVRRDLDLLMQQKIRQWRELRNARVNLEDERLQSFYHCLAQRMLRAGWLRLQTLRVGDKVAATVFGLEYGGTYYSCQQSYNLEFEKYSAGRLLILHILEDGFARGLREFDMLIGDEPYKMWLHPTVRRLYELSLFQTGARGRLAEAWMRRARPWLARGAQRNQVLQPLGRLAQRLKQRAG